MKPVVRAADEEEEEELVDPHQELKAKCSEAKHCAGYKAKLEECNDRVNSRSKTAETCVEELVDFYHCVDHCIVKDLFKMLK